MILCAFINRLGVEALDWGLFSLVTLVTLVVEDISPHLEREWEREREWVWTCSEKGCYCLSGRVEADSGNRSSTLFLNWRNPVYGLSACGILVRFRDLEGKSIWGRVPCCFSTFSTRSLQINFFNLKLLNSQPANMKEGIATRACSV